MKVTITGIDDVLAKLKKVSEVDEAIKAAILELLQTAEQTVIAKYSLRSGDGNTDFTTEIQTQADGGTLYISGADVGFLEFGAGVFTEANEFASEVDYPVYPGSWSESHPHSDNPNARYFAKNGFWWWSNIRYTGLAPTRGAMTALEEIRNTADEVVQKKVNEWIG